MAYKTTIDAAGRIVVPKDLRRRLGLTSGRRLCLTEEGDRLIVVLEPEEPTLRERAGILVLAGSLDGEVPDHRALRDERIQKLVRR